MSAMRILLLVLALAAVAFVAKFALTGAASAGRDASAGAERSAPARQLDNVRGKAKDIEGEMQKSLERADKPASGE